VSAILNKWQGVSVSNVTVETQMSQKISYSLIQCRLPKTMQVDGSKIIFGLGVLAAVATAAVALFFAIS